MQDDQEETCVCAMAVCRADQLMQSAACEHLNASICGYGKMDTTAESLNGIAVKERRVPRGVRRLCHHSWRPPVLLDLDIARMAAGL
jgi:hypothetical protein